jgi:hypothetical protein
MPKQVHYHVELNSVQKSTIAVALLFIVVIAVITAYSPNVSVYSLGLFLQLLGTILLGLGLVKTNDELAEIVKHHEKLDKQRLISHLTKDRFFIVIGVFLVVLGLLMQIIGRQA